MIFYWLALSLKDDILHLMLYFYCITNLINQKIYVGITSSPTSRWRFHKAIAKGGIEKYPSLFQYIHAAMAKYGIDNFTFEISKAFNNEDEAYLYEEDQINYLKSLNVAFYNIAPGGKGCRPGAKHPRFGIKLTSEQIEKMSAVMIGKMSGNKNPMFGKSHSEVAKKAVSLANKGRKSAQRKFSDEQIREIKKLIKSGLSAGKISKIFKVTKRTILSIKNKKYYKEID